MADDVKTAICTSGLFAAPSLTRSSGWEGIKSAPVASVQPASSSLVMAKSLDSPQAFEVDNNAKVVHSRFAGVWDLYELHRKSWSMPTSATWYRLKAATLNLNQVHRALLRLLMDQPGVFLTYFFCELVAEVALPNVSLWLGGRLLDILNTALETHAMNLRLVIIVVASKSLTRILRLALRRHAYASQTLLQRRLQNHFILHLVKVRARLDMPTFNDGPIARQLEAASLSDYGEAMQAWAALSEFWELLTTIMSLSFSLLVVCSLLWKHERILPLALSAFMQPFFEILVIMTGADNATRAEIWAATCTNAAYIKFRGLRKSVVDQKHRQEIVVGNIGEHIASESDKLASVLEHTTFMSDFNWNMRYSQQYVAEFLSWPKIGRVILEELPYMALAFLALKTPQDLPLLLASMSVVESAVFRLTSSFENLMRGGKDIFKRFTGVKQLYELANIQNKIEDGTIPFPENVRDAGLQGLSIEFRNVSFKYPGTDILVLRNVSFTIFRGTLAVVVGFNGSGKSTILKLIGRVYDATEGQILIDGKDIRTLRLRDLRETIAIMFQDHTLFPLSIRDNIGYGDPANAWDDEAVQAAVQLAGVDFEHKFTHGLETYINHPVRDHYSELPEGTQSLFGRPVKFADLKAGVSSRDISLSGGQTQKIAVARAIMRATSKDDRVGIVMFDEPSSAMDPIAEYSLFKTLRRIRGGKTMIFSSHRYGNLTRHADMVFYMKDGEILERGTHDELIKSDGGYAEMWKRQAEAFTT